MSEHYIPVIDFGACSLGNEECSHDALAAVGKLLVDAFSNVGFAYLKNTGISDSYIEDVHKVTDKFFTSSNEEKTPYAKQGLDKFGWFGIGKENATGDANIPADYKEAFNTDGEAFKREQEEWPDKIAPGFSKAVLGFMERGQKLAFRVLHALAIGLGLKDEHFFHKCHSKIHTVENFTGARIAFYPPLKSELQPGQLRCGEHSDTTSITFVFQDQIGGLQVKAADGEYVDATPIKDTAVVNVGDILEFWTNHQLKSTKHRVVVKESEVKNTVLRRSLVYFVVSNNDAVINKPLIYKDENKNTAVESEEPFTTEDWVNRIITAAWKTALKED